MLDVVADILLIPERERNSALELQLVNILCEPAMDDHDLGATAQAIRLSNNNLGICCEQPRRLRLFVGGESWLRVANSGVWL